MFRFANFVTLTLITWIALSADVFSAGSEKLESPNTFRLQEEFPNLFLPKQYRLMAPADIPNEVITHARQLASCALASMMNRMTLPIIEKGANEIKRVKFTQYVADRIPKSVRFQFFGGSTREPWGLLYQRLVEAESIGRESQDELQAIAKETQPISVLDLKGLGSDLDLTVTGGTASERTQAIEIITAITNSVEDSIGLTSSQDPSKRLFLTIGDAKEFDRQSARASSQGGANIDWIGFDPLANDGKGEFLEPAGHAGIVDGVLRGYYDYLPPSEPGPVSLKQISRALRALLSCPWLQIRNPEYLQNEISQVVNSKGEVSSVPEEVRSQLVKMMRSARFGGAFNRLFRSAVGTVESIFLKAFGGVKDENGFPILHELIETIPLEKKSSFDAKIPDLIKEIQSYFIPVDLFIKQYAHEGYLYHGTPTLDQAVLILRSTLAVSSRSQGHAAYGRGAYSSGDFETARGYANGRGGIPGFILKLKVKNDPRVRVLNRPRLPDRLVQKIEATASAYGMEANEFLYKVCGVDYMTTDRQDIVLIGNSNGFDTSQGIRDFVPVLQNKKQEAFERASDLKTAIGFRLRSFMTYRLALQMEALLTEECKIAFNKDDSLLYKELSRSFQEDVGKKLEYLSEAYASRNSNTNDAFESNNGKSLPDPFLVEAELSDALKLGISPTKSVVQRWKARVSQISRDIVQASSPSSQEHSLMYLRQLSRIGALLEAQTPNENVLVHAILNPNLQIAKPAMHLVGTTYASSNLLRKSGSFEFTPEIWSALIERLSDPATTEKALFALGQGGSPPPVGNHIAIDLLRSPSKEVRLSGLKLAETILSRGLDHPSFDFVSTIFRAYRFDPLDFWNEYYFDSALHYLKSNYNEDLHFYEAEFDRIVSCEQCSDSLRVLAATFLVDLGKESAGLRNQLMHILERVRTANSDQKLQSRIYELLPKFKSPQLKAWAELQLKEGVKNQSGAQKIKMEKSSIREAVLAFAQNGSKDHEIWSWVRNIADTEVYFETEKVQRSHAQALLHSNFSDCARSEVKKLFGNQLKP